LVGCQAAIAGKPAPTVGSGVFSQKLVGCQAAIAGKPAPQWDRVSSVRNWSAGRPPSLASQFLHGTGCFQSEIGRLSGRLRWQASSHSGIGCHQLEIGRLSGRHRWQASSHSGIGCFQLEIGRLSGRHRWQASSHNFIRAHPMRRSRPTQHDER
jgi:hypothetical protein